MIFKSGPIESNHENFTVLDMDFLHVISGLVVHYDMTVRDSDKSIIQFQYGEDSLDVCKSQYLRNDQMKFLYENR
jgi:DNA-directed RNA polymerase beta' subunit